MNLRILTPARIFAAERDLARIVVETPSGSMGLLPHRRDFAAAVVPGILTYEGAAGGPVYLAVDSGVMIKTGDDVVVSVRHAVGGAGLADLEAAVKRDFIRVGEQERAMQSAMVKLEGGLIRHMAELQHAR